MSEQAASSAAKRKIPNGPGSSSLLNLPTEIWTNITELVVIREEPITIFSSICPHRNKNKVMQPGITRTCTALRVHGLPIFYQQNIFIASQSVSMPTEMVQWFKAIGWTNRSQLKHLYMRNSWKETDVLIDEACEEAGIGKPERRKEQVPGTEMYLCRLVFLDLDWVEPRRRGTEPVSLARFDDLLRQIAVSFAP